MQATINYYYPDKDKLKFDVNSSSYGPAFGILKEGRNRVDFICLTDKGMVEDLRNFLDFSLVFHDKIKNNPFRYRWVVFHCGEYFLTENSYPTASECKEAHVPKDTPTDIFRVVRKIDETQEDM